MRDRAYRKRAAEQRAQRQRFKEAREIALGGARAARGNVIANARKDRKPLNSKDSDSASAVVELVADLFTALEISPNEPHALVKVVARLATTFLPAFQVGPIYREKSYAERIAERNAVFMNLFCEHMRALGSKGSLRRPTRKAALQLAFEDKRFENFAKHGATDKAMLAEIKRKIPNSAAMATALDRFPPYVEKEPLPVLWGGYDYADPEALKTHALIENAIGNLILAANSTANGDATAFATVLQMMPRAGLPSDYAVGPGETAAGLGSTKRD